MFNPLRQHHQIGGLARLTCSTISPGSTGRSPYPKNYFSLGAQSSIEKSTPGLVVLCRAYIKQRPQHPSGHVQRTGWGRPTNLGSGLMTASS